MASVSSLDQDMRRLRLDRYTPTAANEVRQWIEESLGEKLAPGDLMDALKDGTALCKLVNRVTLSGVRYKASTMPFVQMENISHFLRACEMPPLNLPSHDRFLTVDLYDRKDPAQVLQCLAAFSRRANATNSREFPNVIGAASKGKAMSPQGTGSSQTKTSSYTKNTPPMSSARSVSPAKSNSLGRGGLATGGPVSSWSKKDDEQRTAPAWNIHQYGYMGGANQGNQGVSFGARRQLVTQQPQVPSLAEKEQRLRAAEEQRQREAEFGARRDQAVAEEEELKAAEEEQRRWSEATRLAHERERAEERQSEKHEMTDKAPEAATPEQKYEAKLAGQRTQQRQVSDSRLNGQFLSQYRALKPRDEPTSQQSAESKRVAELERQLAEAKEAARNAEQARYETPAASVEQSIPVTSTSYQELQISHEEDWDASEREYLKQQQRETQKVEADSQRRIPEAQIQPITATSTQPLPEPEVYIPYANRTDRFLSSNPAPTSMPPVSHRSQDYSTTAEVDLENQRRLASQQKTKASGWASKSLLEREMERERERQKEWEENQKETASRARVDGEGSALGQSWNVNQYGYTGGANQFKGGAAFSLGGARRQIIGPRPPP